MAFASLRALSKTDIMWMLPPTLIWQQKGGEGMDLIITFLVSVAAGIAAYYICKRLDRHDRKEQ